MGNSLTHSLGLNLDNCTTTAIKRKCSTHLWMVYETLNCVVYWKIHSQSIIARQRRAEKGSESERRDTTIINKKLNAVSVVQWKLTTCCHSLWNVYWTQLSMRRQDFSSPCSIASIEEFLYVCVSLSLSFSLCNAEVWMFLMLFVRYICKQWC